MNHKKAIKKIKAIKVNHNKGQAVFEFLIFLPFMMILYSIVLTIANAINGSINQQKITRGYYFNLIHNDSFVPNNEILNDFRRSGINQIGMFAVGWRMKSDNEKQIAPCYKILSLSKITEEEQCVPGNKTGTTTQYIRVKTAFGICSGTYYNENGQYVSAINLPMNYPVSSYSSCFNQN